MSWYDDLFLTSEDKARKRAYEQELFDKYYKPSKPCSCSCSPPGPTGPTGVRAGE